MSLQRSALSTSLVERDQQSLTKSLQFVFHQKMKGVPNFSAEMQIGHVFQTPRRTIQRRWRETFLGRVAQYRALGSLAEAVSMCFQGSRLHLSDCYLD